MEGTDSHVYSYSAYLPINTATTYDNTQKIYNVTRVLGPNISFDEQKYKAYSPMFLSPTFALNYGLSFAALTAAIVHAILFHRKELWHQFKASREQQPDIHLRLMKRYREVPDWWYGALFLFSIALGLTSVLAYDSQLSCASKPSPSFDTSDQIYRVGLLRLHYTRCGVCGMLSFLKKGTFTLNVGYRFRHA